MDFFIRHPINYKWILFTAILVYIITAYNSLGYFHADEHFQIIEFAKMKAGLNNAWEMPWEYKEQIRPTIQPVMCLLLFRFLNFLHITDYYLLAFILRLLSAFLALINIHYFIRYTSDQIRGKNEKTVYYVLSYFIWFVPFISVRFSSETWGGLFFLSALTLYLNPNILTRKFFLIGCMLGISFLFRFQMAFASFGFILWLLFISKMTFQNTCKLITGIVTVVVIGTAIDCWFYKKLLFTPWNYFYMNLVKDVASVFGTSPWYNYIWELYHLPGFFLGACCILAFIILLFTDPKNVFIWSVLPFFIVHSIIPHKEERFMFPLAYLLPVVLMLSYEKLALLLKGAGKIIVNYIFIIPLLVTNLIGLFAIASRSPGIGRMEISKTIHDKYGMNFFNLLHGVNANVYDKHGGIMPYPEKSFRFVQINNLCDVNDSILVPGKKNLLVITKRDLQMESCTSAIAQNHFVFIKQSVPRWLEWLNTNIYKGFDNLDIFELYEQK